MSENLRNSILFKINTPDDLRRLSINQLPELSKELRNYIIHTLDQCGGHFGANLGTVELAIALHYVYRTPADQLVWDVGHQAYPHKILTGRRDQLNTIKQPGGLAPFPKRDESSYDSFGTGHSSTSISAALGMSIANQLNHNNQHAVAIIGDGGLTGGMAFEAMNHAGSLDTNLLIVLNDNDMSISANVGALTHYLRSILSGKIHSNLCKGSKNILSRMSSFSYLAKKTEKVLKKIIVPGNIFEALGFNYFGPVDGHNVIKVVKTLETLKHLKCTKLLHITTTKGKGYAPAEAKKIEYHAVKPGFYSEEKVEKKSLSEPTYSEIFGEWLCDMARSDPNLVGITPAMCEGSGMQDFAKKFPERYHDVGIAEQHSVTFAAGLASEGKKPIVAIYSSFLQRAYDQLIHDVALQNLDVTFALDRAGLVGADGPTHAGTFDLSFLACIPNMVIMAPADESECRQMLTTAYRYPGPAAVRYPRGSGPSVSVKKSLKALPIGKGLYARMGKKIAILSFGALLSPALEAAEPLNATVINMRFIKPLDEDLVREVAQLHSFIITLEENTIKGGAGSVVNEFILNQEFLIQVLNLGLPDYFIEHGIRSKMLKDCGLDAGGIIKSIQKRLSSQKFSDLLPQ